MMSNNTDKLHGMLIKEYLDLQEKYEKKWGEKTIVLMEVGKFFEIYGVVNETEKRGRIYEIAEFTNLSVSKKNSKTEPVSIKNPLMAGFPNYTIKKWEEIILKHKYTIIKIEQDQHGTKNPNREVTEILSPGINLESNNYSNNIMSITLEEYQDYKSLKKILQLGLSIVDITTGKSWVYETHSHVDDFNYCLDECFRFIQSYNPLELIIDLQNTNLKKNDITNYLEISSNNLYFNIFANKNLLTNKNKNYLLSRVFPDSGSLSPVEYIDLEKYHFALNSFIYLIQFVYEHNENIVTRLQKPIICKPERYLNLSHDSINQLDIIVNIKGDFNKNKSLWNILDKTKTCLGKRFLKENLLNPLLDINELNTRYDLVESLIYEERFLLLNDKLKDIVDIERLHRKMAMGIMNPHSFISLDISYSNILAIYQLLIKFNINYSENILPNFETFNAFKQCIKKYTNSIILEQVNNVLINDIKRNIFFPGLYPEIDQIQSEINDLNLFFENLAKEIDLIIDNTGKKLIEIKVNDNEGHYLYITSSKFKILDNYIKKNNDVSVNISFGKKKINYDLKNLKFKHTKSYSKIVSEEIKTKSITLQGLEDKMKKMCLKKFSSLLTELYLEYYPHLNKICKFIAYLDYLTNVAFVSKLYGYYRPIIKQETSSYLEAEELRHPIIEKIHDQVKYVANDVILGKNSINGMLLYGVNAVGKSSLMKSVGIAIVMAQAGFYVPAKKFTYSPYHQLFTRISNNDNIFKGQSSFAVEMTELRTILKRADNKSLVLGDELCSGTETISGTALVAAGIKRLSSLNTSFIFATHLHKLSELNIIDECDNVHHFHMKTIFDNISKNLIYDRKLTLGSGDPIYGLEVAKGMDLDEEFIEMANQIRKEIMNVDKLGLEIKSSKYNSKIIIDKCNICKDPTDEVHHINEQHLADKNNMIDYFHKNSLFNLVQLCHSCHQKVHNGNLLITGFVDTSDGIKLKYHNTNDTIINKKKKYNSDQIAIIQDIYSKSNNFSLTKKTLKNEYQINVGASTLKKIVNKIY